MFITLIIVPLMLITSILFYRQFREALNERVLLHLSSIQMLKRIQIEDYVDAKCDFLRQNYKDIIPQQGDIVVQNGDSLFFHFSGKAGTQTYLKSYNIDTHLLHEDSVMIYDISSHSNSGLIKFMFIYSVGDSLFVSLHANMNKIESILLERTGMGETGETYLVDDQYQMRTTSRFFPETEPSSLEVNTEGARQALLGFEGSGVFPDYRGVNVYSVYGQIRINGLKWIILSEIDESEGLKPLKKLRFNLVLIGSSIIIIALFISLGISIGIVRPIVKVKRILSEMALGKFGKLSVERTKKVDEIDEMFEALSLLDKAIYNAITFADQLGIQNFDMDYRPLSEYDTLGDALISMRDKLKEYRQKEEQYQIKAQKALLQGQENERGRVAKELHDGLGPLLTTLKMSLQGLTADQNEIAKIKSMIDDILIEVRRISNNLMPQALLDFGVGEALANLAAFIRKVARIEINYVNSLETNSNLSEEINIGIYRIAQEAINNAIKHADATVINMSLTEFDNSLNFFFKDNGKGFDTSERFEGSGLLNMKERCRLLNGNFYIESNEEGTTIEVEIIK